MLDLVDLGTLIAYRDTVTKYHSRYGTACWLITYQTDVRTRLEQMPRNCRRLASRHNAALAAGGSTEFTPARPCGHALQAAMDETNWWRSELEEPALLALTKSQALGQLIAGDAAVAATAGAAFAVLLVPRMLRMPLTGVAAVTIAASAAVAIVLWLQFLQQALRMPPAEAVAVFAATGVADAVTPAAAAAVVALPV